MPAPSNPAPGQFGCQATDELARLLLAHLAASVFIGSILSHSKQTRLVRPVLSFIVINLFLHVGQRL